MEDARESHDGAVHGAAVTDPDVDVVAFRGEFGASRAQAAAQAVAGRSPLEGEVEILRVSRQPEEEAETGPALERQGGHRPGALQRAQDAGLQILPGDVPPPQRFESGHEALEMVPHSASYPGASRARRRLRSAARASFGVEYLGIRASTTSSRNAVKSSRSSRR